MTLKLDFFHSLKSIIITTWSSEIWFWVWPREWGRLGLNWTQYTSKNRWCYW